jgi:hypothetical protein
MSYARFGWDSSDVYVFQSVGFSDHPNGWLECCACGLGNDETWGRMFRAFSTQEMLDHLQAHRDVGDSVPQDCIDGLLEDRAENDALIAGAAS